MARLESFTRAADELAVTQSAVSHQIRALEQHFGVRLFERRNPEIALTEEGATLLPMSGRVRPAGRGGGRLSQRQRGGILRVTVTETLAAGWLVPRLGRFVARFPEIEIRLAIRLWDPDLMEADADIALGLCRIGATMDDNSLILLREKVFPVCAPRLAPLVTGPEALANLTLLHEETRGYEALTWDFWFRRLSIGHLSPRRGIRLNTFGIVIAAAAEGVGVALGRQPMIDAELESGRLVRPFGDSVAAGDMVHVARWRPDGRPEQKGRRISGLADRGGGRAGRMMPPPIDRATVSRGGPGSAHPQMLAQFLRTSHSGGHTKKS